MAGGREPVARVGFAIGDSAADPRRFLFMKKGRVVAVDLGIQHCASHGSVAYGS